MTVCVSCWLYLLRDSLENLISRETEGRARCQNFPMHREFQMLADNGLVYFYMSSSLIYILKTAI